MRNTIRTITTATATCALLGLAAPAAADQLPATPHQAEAVEDVQRATKKRPDKIEGMAATKHQEQVMREFEAADTNRDGSLSRDEYAAYMTTHAAKLYDRTLHKPEGHGVDAAGGPRDRAEAAGREQAVPMTDPTVGG